MPYNNTNSPFRGLAGFLSLLRTDLLNSLQSRGKPPSGQTLQQITIEGDENSAILQVPGFLAILEKGRGPTGKNAVKGNPTMIDRIKQWCQAKGIPDKAAWAIKKSIDKKGFKGTPGLLTEPLGDANINIRLNQTLNQVADTITTQIADNIPS